MTAIAPRTREARIYRVNAWRQIKGRPALTFADPGLIFRKPAGDVSPNQPRPPEWWTEENTRAWNLEQWGNPDGNSEAQRGWGKKYEYGDHIGRAGALCYRPIPAKDMAKWRASDPRPAPYAYFDGTPVDYAAARQYAAANVKPKRTRKVRTT